MQHMGGGELYSRLRLGAPSFPEIEVQSIAKQMLTALECLHANNICHKDVRPKSPNVHQKSPTVYQKSSTM